MLEAYTLNKWKGNEPAWWKEGEQVQRTGVLKEEDIIC